MSSIDHLHSETKMLQVEDCAISGTLSRPDSSSVQTVEWISIPHLFNCTALTHENLWNRPAKTIREVSFIDPKNLVWTIFSDKQNYGCFG